LKEKLLLEVDRGTREPCDLVVVSSAGAGTGDTASDDADAIGTVGYH
jgi:hypothetical protein